MRRRHLLTAVSASAASLAGCNGLLGSEGDGGATTAPEQSPTTSQPTTSSPVRSAIAEARDELAEAFDHFGEYAMVEGGQPTLGRENVSGYGRRPASDPAAVARSVLEEVRDSATGEQAERIAALRTLANYTTEKAGQYLYLAAGQIGLYKYKAASAAEDEGHPAARDHARTAQRYFRRGSNYGANARTVLGNLASAPVLPEVEGFAIDREQTEQEVLEGQSTLLSNTAGAFANHAEGLVLTDEGTEAYENEEYEIAAARYASATAVMNDADDRISAVRDRQPAYHAGFVAFVGCQTGDLAEGLAFMYEAANAQADGDPARADRLERRARELFRSVQERCFTGEGSETTPG